jgi:hypothetical protein
MNAFNHACLVETRAMEDIVPFLKRISLDGRYVLTNKGNLSQELQKMVGDAVLNSHDGRIWGVEIKAEESDRHGNFFFETWSNRKRFTPGWMFTLRADILLYYFIKERLLYSFDFFKLRSWAFMDGNINKYPEKPQGKYSQLNDTWGRCVPIIAIEKEVGLRKYNLAEQADDSRSDNPPSCGASIGGVPRFMGELT